MLPLAVFYYHPHTRRNVLKLVTVHAASHHLLGAARMQTAPFCGNQMQECRVQAHDMFADCFCRLGLEGQRESLPPGQAQAHTQTKKYNNTCKKSGR